MGKEFFQKPEKTAQEPRRIDIEKVRERKEGEAKLVKFVGELAQRLKNEGVPVTADCRIDMEAFSAKRGRSEVEKDKKELNELKKKMVGDLEQRGMRDGEKLELLKTAIFAKYLGEGFVVSRSSEFDDIKRGIDNVILEKSTGNLVCAFDEVVTRPDQAADGKNEEQWQKYLRKRAEDKKEKIREKNAVWGGGNLKYGIGMHKGEIVLGEYSRTPMFCLSLTKEQLEEAVKRLEPSFEKHSEYEQAVFGAFIGEMYQQYTQLNLETQLKPELKQRLDVFGKTLARFSSMPETAEDKDKNKELQKPEEKKTATKEQLEELKKKFERK